MNPFRLRNRDWNRDQPEDASAYAAWPEGGSILGTVRPDGGYCKGERGKQIKKMDQ